MTALDAHFPSPQPEPVERFLMLVRCELRRQGHDALLRILDRPRIAGRDVSAAAALESALARAYVRATEEARR